MLDAVIRFSLRSRFLVMVASLAMLVVGTYLATQMPIDVFPDLDRPRVVIIAECPGLATEEVELLVTQPIEIALVGGNGVEAVRSQSTAGLTVIYVEFNWDVDVRAARQTVQERLSAVAGVLPQGIRPQMTPTASIMGQIVIAGIFRRQGPHGGELATIPGTSLVAEWTAVDATASPSGDTQADAKAAISIWRVADRQRPATWEEVPAESMAWLPESLPKDAAGERPRGARLRIAGKDRQVVFPTPLQQSLELRTTADWVVRPRLLKISGIAEVFVQGGDRKQYQILVDPAAMLEYGVSLLSIEQAIRESNINASGGFAVQGEEERPIRLLGRLGPDAAGVIADLKQVPVVVHPRRAVLLAEVADVVEGPQVKRGDGAVEGRPGVVFTIAKQPHVDTRALTDRIEEALSEVEASLPAEFAMNSELFRLVNFIDRGVFNVGEALVIGGVLVVLVLFVFLMNLRTTFITLTAIPLSLVITMLVFRLAGMLTGSTLSINVMTLGGIAVAMGELVDDAIVDVENIFRRLQENNALPVPRPPLVVVYEASCEIRGAIVFGTVVVILVFLPLFALSGIEGRLFAPLGVAYIVSILASLLVSLTVTPVLSFYLLPRSQATHRTRDGLLLRGLKHLATPLIRVSMAVPGMLLALTWIGVALAGWELVRLGRDFLPPFDEGSVQVNVTLPPGSSLEASNATCGTIDAKLRSLQKSEERPRGEILHFVRRTGRAEMDEHAAPVNVSEYILSINPDCGRHRDEIITSLLADLASEAPGVGIEVEQPLAHLISHMVSGVYAQIAIKVSGDDLGGLVQTAEEIKRAIQDVPGLTPPLVEPIQETDELHIRLRAEDLAFHGLTRQQVARVIQTALQGEVVSQVLEGQRRSDLLVRLEDEARNDMANLGRLRIDLPERHGQIELGELAEISVGTGPNAVNRENARRRIVVRCNTQGRDLAGAVADIRRRIDADVVLPKGSFIEYGGQFESQERATAWLVGLAALSAVGMFVVLMLLFPSVRIVLQLLNALPTAFIGGAVALAITAQPLTVASLVGFISLGGIAVRNGILLVTHYVHLMQEEGENFSKAMILRGSLERLAPVLMTAITAGIGLVPLVVGGQEPGREILYPVATVILGGLITSTFCEFLIHPGLFWKFSGRDALQLAREDDPQTNLSPGAKR
jgi:CzcA family heavy metal efflux pump